MVQYSLKTLTLEDEAEIKKILAWFPKADIYSDPRYLRLFQNYTGERAIYFYYDSGACKILLPIFERTLPFAAPYKDMVSSWYYGGPIYNFKNIETARIHINNFLPELNKYCLENNIVSEFQRLNPMLENHKFYESDAQTPFNRKIVYIDLNQDLESVHKEYLYKARKNINKAHRSGLKVVRQKDEDGIKKFFNLYTASLKHRKETRPFYYFNQKFFLDMFESLRDGAELFNVYFDGKLAASSVVLGCGETLYDYLRASDPALLDLRPNDFVVDEIVVWSKTVGYKYYDLGGGRSGAEDDKLFEFKKSFSQKTRDFYMYKKIHNLPKYKELCALAGKKESELAYESAEFFPEYGK